MIAPVGMPRQGTAAASPGPAAEPQSLCMTANTLSYSQCLGMDGKRLPGEGIHLILAWLAGVPGTASAAAGCDTSAKPWCWRRQRAQPLGSFSYCLMGLMVQESPKAADSWDTENPH